MITSMLLNPTYDEMEVAMKLTNLLRSQRINLLTSWKAVSLAVVMLVALTGPATAQSQKDLRDKDIRGRQQPLAIARQGSFYVGGQYITGANGQIMAGQMYVRYQIPQNPKNRYPLVFIHGGGPGGHAWEET